MSAAHTPGPWWFAADAPDTYAIGAGDIELAGGLRRENARLIAAAPELLEALRDVLGTCGAFSPRGKTAIDAARAVLAKVQP